MANTFMISLPDDLRPVVDQLKTERRLSAVIAELLKKWYEQQQMKKK